MTAATKPKCFVISPIGGDDTPERKHADQVLRHLIRAALETQFAVLRADEDSDPGEITPRMIASILEADLVVADVTGGNANVFYEVAIAHGYRRPTVVIQEAGDKRNFDIKDIRALAYDLTDPDNLEAAVHQLRKYAEHAVNSPEDVTNPLSAAARFAQVQQSADPVAESNVQVMAAIDELRGEVRKMRRPIIRRVSTNTPADLLSALKIIRSVVDDGRARDSDFADVINPDTSTKFDAWVREQLAQANGLDAVVNQEDLDELLFDHQSFADRDSSDQ